MCVFLGMDVGHPISGRFRDSETLNLKNAKNSISGISVNDSNLWQHSSVKNRPKLQKIHNRPNICFVCVWGGGIVFFKQSTLSPWGRPQMAPKPHGSASVNIC